MVSDEATTSQVPAARLPEDAVEHGRRCTSRLASMVHGHGIEQVDVEAGVLPGRGDLHPPISMGA
jgi:hypothetical protein